ncbi:EAL domain-containing protein [Lachnospiraceae bacterium ZAX-1]
MARMKRILGEIKKMGVRIALDDFGTGYSSLNHIREMPIDVIKIDRCFIMDLGQDEYAELFVKIVAKLASTIDMKMCIEGVETEEQYKILRDMRIQMIQGYYFDKPMSCTKFETKYVYAE